MTKRDPFPPLDRKPALPTPGDWIGGIALAVATAALFVCAGALQ